MTVFEGSDVFGSGFGRGDVNPAILQRLSERHKRIVDANREYFEGKRVLDLGSHNGRWTYAALKAGASFALGIEGRGELIDNGMAEFKDYGQDRVQFAQGNVYDAVSICSSLGYEIFDTVLCLGLIYHVSDHYRLLRVMRAFNPNAIIIDGSFVKDAKPLVRFKVEDANDPAMGLGEGETGKAIAGVASLGLLRRACEISGYVPNEVPWRAEDTEYPDPVKDYLDDSRNAKRYTFCLTARPDKPHWTTVD